MFCDFSFFQKNINYVSSTSSLSLVGTNSTFHLFSNSFALFFSDLTGFYKNQLTIHSFFRVGFLFRPLSLFFIPGLSIQVSSNWVFREFNEFFSNVFVGFADKRNVLLDYRLQVKPLTKGFVSSGTEEIYYSTKLLGMGWSQTSYVEL